MPASQPGSSLSAQLLSAVQVPVPDDMRNRAGLLFLDWLGCVIAASRAPVASSLAVYGKTNLSGKGNCFTACAGPLAVQDAVFINGALGNVLEMDDVHRDSIMHVGDVVTPVALAVAQHTSSTTTVFLDSIVKAYEVAIRLGNVAVSGGYSAWYNSGTCGVFGATVAAGLQMNLSTDQLTDAMGQAGMLSSGLWQCRLEPTYSKQLATGHAAQMGVLAAQLSGIGFPGPKQILEGQLGFFSTYYPESCIDDLDTSAAEQWALRSVSIKPWSACRHTHAAIEAALQLRTELADERPAIIRVATYGAALEFCDNPVPLTDHEARFSLQHCVAVALVRGDPSIEDFQAEARNDPELVRVAGMVQLVVDKGRDKLFPGRMSAEVTITLPQGQKLQVSVENAYGDPENPMSTAAIFQKFRNNVDHAGVSAELADQLIYLTESMSETISMNGISAALETLSIANRVDLIPGFH